ncbi:addiction module protein [Rheinheimera hassiensis]
MQLVEDLWDSIAQDQQALPVTDAQRSESLSISIYMLVC